jgi:hypothetical protein
MIPPGWADEADAFIRAFAARAVTWDEHPGDLAADAAEPWSDPDHPDPVLDAAYRSGIVPAAERDIDDGWDSITVLRARGRRLAKLIAPDGGIVDYDATRLFDLIEIPVNGLDHLEDDLRRLLHQPDRCTVRGRIAEIGRCRGVRRLLHPEGNDPASLIEAPRRWLALDIDGLPRPVNVPAADLVACAGIAIAALPSEFHDARCLAQATAGHGYKPGLRLRLWYWLDRPLGAAELKRWFAGAPVDHALFSPAQIIYSAAPVFAGKNDPLPARLVRLPHGTACVAVPELPEPAPQYIAAPVRPATGLSRYAEAALDNAGRSIAAAGHGDRDRAINSAAYGIGRLAGAGAIPRTIALRVLHHAAAQIPGYSAKRDASKVDRSFDDGLRNPREALNA